jgi:hypothetical protein
MAGTEETRSAALAAAVDAIARAVPDLDRLAGLLDQAGMLRLAARLRGRRPAKIRGEARPDPEMWLRGRLS